MVIIWGEFNPHINSAFGGIKDNKARTRGVMTCSNPLTWQVRQEAEAMIVGAGVCTGAQGLEGACI